MNKKRKEGRPASGKHPPEVLEYWRDQKREQAKRKKSEKRGESE